MNEYRKICFDRAKRIVVKVGSGVLTEDNGLNLKVIRSISRQVSFLIDQGIEVILVSSGAMASGIKKSVFPKDRMKFPRGRQQRLSGKQA